MAPPEPIPLARLPHGGPAVLLTAAFLDPTTGAVRGVRETGPADPRGNAAGFLPQCLLVELMGQTAGLALPPEFSGALVGGIRRLRLRRAARAGDRVETEALLERRVGKVFSFKCRARASGRLLAHGSIVLRAT